MPTNRRSILRACALIVCAIVGLAIVLYVLALPAIIGLP